MNVNLDERLEAVSVAGAAGKMGRGICLLLVLEMARRKRLGRDPGGDFRLHAIDVDEAGLDALAVYLDEQVRKTASRHPGTSRGPDSPDGPSASRSAADFELFVRDVKEILRPTTRPEDARGSRLVFEAVVEDEDAKVGVLSRLREIAAPDACFFSNTSSIPIRVLDARAGLAGRIIGFHFFNPPAVQKLVELITHPGTRPDLVALAEELGRRLERRLIRSRDVAGFVSNGFFIREGLHAIGLAAELERSMSQVGSLYALDRITREWLLRPMGIFQLIDYVGIDIFRAITQAMTRHSGGEDFRHPLIEDLFSRRVLGGQRLDGSQRDGLLSYASGRPTGVLSLAAGDYVSFGESDWTHRIDEQLGPLPEGAGTWKALLKDADREARIAAHFARLREMSTVGASLSREYLHHLRRIGEKLVSDGVAASPEDVNAVLMGGFYHLYGPLSGVASAPEGEGTS